MGFKLISVNEITSLSFVIFIFLLFNNNETLGQFKTRNSTTLNLRIINSNVNQTEAEPSTINPSNGTSVGGVPEECECMEYWSCTRKKGQIYSYCGLSDSQVCCFLNDPVKPSMKTLVSNTAAVVPKPRSMKTSAANTTAAVHKPRSMKALVANTTALVHEPKPSPKASNSTCGVSTNKGIVDSVAGFKEWPWHVAILEAKDDLYICGASLISNRTVLTAAHCISPYVKGKKTQRLKIRVGEYDVSSNSESIPHIEILVSSMILHPNFTSALENDIAVLTLVRTISEIETRENIATVCLPASQTTERFQANLTSKTCVVTGWGRPSENADHSVILKEVNVPLWENKECERKLRRNFGPEYKLPPNSLCAGDEGKDACDGDGGGPLVCFQNGTWIQEGIVSFGIGCGRAGSPGVYTRVDSHLEFLKPFL